MERKDYKRYSREFKLEAVRLAAVGNRPKAQIAREHGISREPVAPAAAGFRRGGAKGSAQASPELRRRPRTASARERQAQGGERDPKKSGHLLRAGSLFVDRSASPWFAASSACRTQPGQGQAPRPSLRGSERTDVCPGVVTRECGLGTGSRRTSAPRS